VREIFAYCNPKRYTGLHYALKFQRVGKITIRELKKRGMTGEELRRLMWERADISTPVRVPMR
jgi:hypothetical protein